VPLYLEVPEQALARGQPELFSTGQGARFTSRVFTERHRKGGMWMSMDGRGRALNNLVVEQLLNSGAAR
jgi:hypothetical protein